MKQYNQALPQWLHNHLRAFVDHVRMHLDSSLNVPKEDIQVLPDEPPTFTIKTDNQKSTCVPFCTCPDWTQNHLPCKHVCAIFRNSAPEYSWDSFSSLYRLHKSIFFNLTMRNQSWETIYQCPKRVKKRLYGSCSIASFVSFLSFLLLVFFACTLPM